MLFIVEGNAFLSDFVHFLAKDGRRGDCFGCHFLEIRPLDQLFELLIGQRSCQNFADGSTVNRPRFPDTLYDTQRPFLLLFSRDDDPAIPKNCEARTFSRQVAQFFKKRRGDLG